MMVSIEFKRDAETGNWIATLGGFYHAVGVTKSSAVTRLGVFMKHNHPEAFHRHRRVLDHYLDQFAPKPRSN